jgi:hypothetical protein
MATNEETRAAREARLEELHGQLTGYAGRTVSARPDMSDATPASPRAGRTGPNCCA